MGEYHIPVMLEEALDNLNIRPEGVYIDCTLGGGGHSLEIAKRLSETGKLISLDIDDDALAHVEKLRKDQDYECEWLLVKRNFSKLAKVLKEQEIDRVDGILFDLGVSSHQIDEMERGFSFRGEAELDMRMNKDLSVKAVDLVNGLYASELEELFKRYGEEPFAKKIAVEIARERENNRIKTTSELLSVIQKVVPFKVRKKSAMRVFQALRIAVNDEIANLDSGLPQALDVLASDGRCVVISFHSLEDRIVKHTFREYEKKGVGLRVYKGPLTPGEDEVARNPRSRSSKMRVFEKL